MLKILTGEVSKGYRKKMIIQKNIKENKYAQMKRFNYDCQIQFYMYVLCMLILKNVRGGLLYSYKTFFENYKEM